MILDRAVFIDGSPARASIGPVGRNISTGRFEPYQITTRFMVTRFPGIREGQMVQDGEDIYFVKYVAPYKTQRESLLILANYQSVQFQRFQPSYDSNLNLTGKAWNLVVSGPANVSHVSGGEQRKEGLLLPTTVLILTMQMTPDTPIQLQDQGVIDGKPYEVKDINLSIIPGLQVLQLSVDERK